MEAVLFDWGHTLVDFEWDDDVLAAGVRAGLGRDDPAFLARYRGLLLEGRHDHRPYRDLLAELGVPDPEAFIDAEHEVWRPQHAVLATAHALLEALRDRGMRTGLVANAWPEPERVLRADLDFFGLEALLDGVTTPESSGARKPAPEIFLHACREVGADPAFTVFVGDGLEADVQGAANVGMTTIQALWFRTDDTPGIEPDFLAFTAMDVLNALRRLAP